MFYPFWNRLDMPEHHGDAGPHAYLMSPSHDRKVFVGRGLALRDPLPNTIHQYFCAAAGNRIQTRLLQAKQYLPNGHAENRVERPDFRGTEGVNMDSRVVVFYEAQGKTTNVVSAAETTFSSIITEPMSFAP